VVFTRYALEKSKMTNLEMLEKMRGPEGFHQFGSAKIMRMFGIGFLESYAWMDWLVKNGHASTMQQSPWEVRLL